MKIRPKRKTWSKMKKFVCGLLAFAMILTSSGLASLEVNAANSSLTIPSLTTATNPKTHLGSSAAVNQASSNSRLEILPSGTNIPDDSDSNEYKLSVNYNTVTSNNNYGYFDVDESKITAHQVSAQNNSDHKFLYIDISSISSSGTTTITNPFKMYFKNVGTVAGSRKLNAEIDITKITISNKTDWGNYPYIDICSVDDDRITFSGGNHGFTNYSSTVDTTSYSVYNMGTFDYDYTVKITYADDGSEYKLPCWEGIYDIDLPIYSSTRGTFIEGWSGDNSDHSKYYVWEFCWLTATTSNGQTTFQKDSSIATGGADETQESSTDKTRHVYNWSDPGSGYGTGDAVGQTSVSYYGDEYLNAGVIAATNSGTFSGTFHSGNCTTDLLLFVSNVDTEPKKTDASGKEYYTTDDTITFNVTQKMGTAYKDTFTPYSSGYMQDTLPDELEYVAGSGKVTSGSTDITNTAGSFSVSGQTVKYTFNSSWLSDMSNYNGQTLTMSIDAKIKGDANGVYERVATNKALTDVSGTDFSTNDLDVTLEWPKLEIVKSADREPPEAYLYNDPDEPDACVVTYTIEVNQVNEKAGTAHNTIITDTLPDEVQLLSAVGDNGTIAEIDGNSFTLNYGDLAYEHTATVTVKAQTLALGEDIPNTAYAIADRTDEVSDDAEIRIIGPKIEITKDADEYQYYVGDTIQYDITVELEDDSECDAKGLVVTDELPDGLELVGTPTVSCQTNARMATHATVTVADDHKSFTVEWPVNKSYYLTMDDVVVIHVTAKATKDVANTIVKNTAVATAVNTPDDVEDDVDVEIIQPILDITKVADKQNYEIGETVTYTISVTQTKSGLTAYNVEIGDDLPDELELLDVKAAATESGTKGDVSRYGNNGFSVKYEQLAYGETAVITVTAKALTAKEGIVNAASANADHTEEVEDEATINVLKPTLSITKDVDKTLYSEGETVTYTIDVKETTGGVTAKNVVVSDTLPDELQLKDVQASDGTVSTKGNEFTVTLDALAYGDTLSITVTAKALTEKENIINTASAVADDTDKVEDDAIITVQRPDITINKVADAKEYYPGDTVTYTIEVENVKEEPSAYDVVVSDTLPDGLELQSVDADGDVSIDGNSFTVTYAEIPYGETVKITVKATALESAANTTLTNVAVAQGSNTDKVEDDEDIDVIKPVLDITKDADKIVYSVDDNVTYTIDVRQTIEGLTAENLVITDTLPDEIELKDAVLSGIEGEVSIEGNSFTINAPALAYGETAIVTVTAIAKEERSEIVNTAYATADHADPVDDDAEIEIRMPALEITKIVDHHDHFVGDEIGFTITVNEIVEDAEAYDVIVSDTMPEGLELTDVRLNGLIGEIAIDGNSFTVTYDAVGFGDEVVILVTCEAEEEAANQDLDNVATVSASNIPEPIEDDDDVILMEPDLSITKDVDKETAYDGEDVTYTIVVAQTVEGAVEDNVIVSDSLPDGLLLKHVTTTDGTVNQIGNDFTVTIPELAYGENVTITVIATVSVNLAGETVINTAYVKGDHTPQKSDDAEFEAITEPVLDITKTVNTEYADINDEIEYTIVVTQIAENATAHDVVVSDDLPDGLELVSVADNSAIIDGNSFSVNVGDLGYNESAEVKLTARITKAGYIDNVAVAEASDASQVEDDADISIEGPELAITKEANKTIYDVGETVIYTITVTQTTKEETAHNVVVSDTLPEGVSLMSAVADRSDVNIDMNGNAFTASGFDLAYGEVVTLTVNAEVLEEADRSALRNVATATSDDATEVSDDAWIGVDMSEEELQDIINNYYNTTTNPTSTTIPASTTIDGTKEDYTENPKTGVYAGIAVAFVLLAAGGAYIVYYRRKKRI